MKTLVCAGACAALLMAAATPAAAVTNGGFEDPGATTSTTIIGSGAYAPGVANGWSVYNNSAATTTVGEVATGGNPDPRDQQRDL